MLCLSEKVCSGIGTGEEIKEFSCKGSLLESWRVGLMKINGKCSAEILLMRKILSSSLKGAEGPKVYKNCKVYNI